MEPDRHTSVALEWYRLEAYGRSRRRRRVDELIKEFLRVRQDLLDLVADSSDLLGQVHPSHCKSAENLLHYIALRSRDLRPMQMRLAKAGLSSLGRAESHVLSAVDAVLSVLHQAVGRPWHPTEPHGLHVDLEAGQQLLAAHTQALLGAIPPERGVAIMVTMPSEAAQDYNLVHHLLEHGMDCMRVNCAHDSEPDGPACSITSAGRNAPPVGRVAC